MGFLRKYDYYARIQLKQLNELTNQNANVLSINEGTAQEFMSSYLRQKFNVSAAFNPTLLWSHTVTYNAGQLVELNYTAWSASPGTYSVGALVAYTDGNAYLCITSATATDIPGTSAKWALVGLNYALYNVTYPQPVFDFDNGAYSVGDMVWYKNKVYTCLVATQVLDHNSAIQTENTFNLPYGNTFPDDPNNGMQVWGTGTTYSVTGTYPNITAT